MYIYKRILQSRFFAHCSIWYMTKDQTTQPHNARQIKKLNRKLNSKQYSHISKEPFFSSHKLVHDKKVSTSWIAWSFNILTQIIFAFSIDCKQHHSSSPACSIRGRNKYVSDEAVNLTSEKHDPCVQKSPTQKKKTRIPCRRHWCGAGQIPSEG